MSLNDEQSRAFHQRNKHGLCLKKPSSFSGEKNTNKQARKQASKQTSKQASKQANKQANKQTNKQTNKQISKHTHTHTDTDTDTATRFPSQRKLRAMPSIECLQHGLQQGSLARVRSTSMCSPGSVRCIRSRSWQKGVGKHPCFQSRKLTEGFWISLQITSPRSSSREVGIRVPTSSFFFCSLF